LAGEYPVEVTTFRIDGEYTDHRRPSDVHFSRDIKDDLSRRDFTINSMAYGGDGIIDFFGGQDDLKNKLIRCVGNPDKRFAEDSLRILRALRFSSTLGFNIEQQTDDSIFRNAGLLNNISKERISAELLKLLCGKNVTSVLIKYRDIIAKIIPEVEPMFDFDQHNKHHIFDVWEHCVYAVGFAPEDPVIRLALLLHDIGKPHCYTVDQNGVGHFYGHGKISADIAEVIMRDLKLSNAVSETVHTLILYHDCSIDPELKIIKRRLAFFTEPILRLLLKVKKADSFAHNPLYSYQMDEIDEVERILEEIIKSEDCISLKDLAVNGDDLIDIGIKKGPDVGKVLNDLLLLVINGEVQNNKDDLIKKASSYI
jgi:tRNA nucleotidyltransferase (CCA-adding enzyme)